MQTLKSLALTAFAAYALLVLALFLMQRSLLYLPDRADMEVARQTLTGVERIELATSDGERIIGWLKPPADGGFLFVYLHGNGANLSARVERLAGLSANGDGFLAVSWRGYGGSTGAPTEAGLIEDGRAAYDAALRVVSDPSRLVLFGESLGTGVAVALAAEREVGGVILEAPFSSTAAVAQSIYWFVPVGLLMRDQFRSDLRIANVRAPLFVMHGEADRVVPIRFGEKLFAIAREPKEFVRLSGVGHQPLDDPRARKRLEEWLRELRTSRP